MDAGQRCPQSGDVTADTAIGQSVASGAKATTRIGISLSAREFTAAKSAFLADWAGGGNCDTFVGWIASALDQHTKRPEQQQQAARNRAPRRASEPSTTRSFDIPTHTVNNVWTMSYGDAHVLRQSNMSEWASDAIFATVQDARRRCGGVLPVPPIQLPNRLTR